MAQSKKRPQLSDAQMEIMNLVWDRGEVTVADVWEALRAKRPVARNTVQTVMTRLEEKRWLKHRAEGKTFHYSASTERESALSQVVSRLVDTAFAGSAEGLVMALLDGRGVSEDEAARIRELIAKAEKGGNGK
jgi:BlaI family transcriptional regulator, penicillinase repressor